MADRSIKINLGANVTGFTAGMRTAQKAAGDFADKGLSKVEKHSGAIDDLAGKTAILGGALTAMAAVAVKKFADFDEAMSSVASTGDDARGSMDALRQAAIEAGADTAFSATEAAGAVEELAKAGVSAKDILGGGLKGSLDLAAAGGLGVAEAAEYASIAMTQFKLSGQDVGHVADLLAAGAGKAMGDVSDLGQALKQGGLVAAATGLTIEETTGALSAFAAAGLLGSDAGTSLKTMLQRLSAPADEASDLMRSLGISAYDAAGEFVGMEAFADQLTRALGDMTPAQRNAAMATMFGSDAVRAANIVYENGAQGIADWIAAVNDQGYAAKTAAVKLDNLKGDLEALGGSLETALITSGSGANDVLRKMVQSADAVVDAIGKIPGPVLSATTLIAGAGGLALLGIAGMMKLTTSVAATRTSLQTLGISAKSAGVAMGAVGAAIGVATIAVSAWASSSAKNAAQVDAIADSLDRVTGKISDNTTEILRSELATKEGFWHSRNGNSAFDDAEKVGISLDLVTRAAAGNVDALKEYQTVAAETEARIRGLRKAGELSGPAWEDQIGALRHVTDAVEHHNGNIEEAIRVEKQKADATKASTAETEKAAPAAEEYARSLEEQAQAADEAWKAIKGLSDGLLGIRNAEVGFEAALDKATDSLKENGRTLDINTEKGRANRTALDDIASSGWAWMDQMREQGATDDELRGKMKRTRDEYIKVAEKMGMSKKAAKELADQLGLIPSKITTDVEVKTADALAGIRKVFDFATGKSITIPVRTSFAGSFPTARASGGAIAGPGTGTSDSIPALLSNGEHVLTASDVAKAGGQGAVYRMRGLIQAGALRFAVGGEVGAASRAVSNASKARDAAKRAVAAEKKDVAAAERAHDRAWGTWAKKRAQSNVSAQKKQLAAAEKRLRDAEKRLDDARARRDRLQVERRDFAIERDRGSVVDQVSSGLSGGLSVVDRVRDMSRSSDYSAAARKRLSTAAYHAERDLTRQYALLEKTNAKISEQSALLNDVKGMRDQIAQQMMGEVKLSGLLGQKDAHGYDLAVTPGAIKAYVADKLAKARKFNSSLDALRKKGAPNALLQEVLGAGIEGGTALADALLSSSGSDWRSITSSWSALERESLRTGDIGTQSAFGTTTAVVERQLASSVAAAEGTQAAIEKIGKGLQTAIGKPLGFARGGLVSGAGTGTSDSIAARLSDGEFVVNARSTAANLNALERINAAPGPVAAPVVAMPMQAGPDWSSVSFHIEVSESRGAARVRVLNGLQEIARTDRAALTMLGVDR